LPANKYLPDISFVIEIDLCRRKMLLFKAHESLTPGVNITNISRAAFAQENPEIVKKD
jgi:hypothetical protein